MPRIINTFSSSNPLAQTIAKLGDVIYGDQLTPALKKQDLLDKQRVALGIEERSRALGAAQDDGTFDFARGAEASSLADGKPEDMAMWASFLTNNMGGYKSEGANNALFGAGKGNVAFDTLEADRNNLFNMNTADNVQSGANNKYSTDVTASTSIANNTADNAQSGANNKYSTDVQASTSIANNTADNTRLWDQFRQEPVVTRNPDGSPGFTNQGDVVGNKAIPLLTDAQRNLSDDFQANIPIAKQLLGPNATNAEIAQKAADLSLPRKSGGITYTDANGNTLSVGGEPGGELAGGLTTANTTRQQMDLINTDQFNTTVDMADKLLSENPGAVGAEGNIKHGVQSATILVNSLTEASGYTSLQEAWTDTQAQALSMGVKPETLDFKYDPAFAEISTLYNIMTFQAVKAIGQQSGNDASNRDFQVIKDTLGDPREWMTNAQDLKARLAIVKKYVGLRRNQIRATLGLPNAPAATPAPTTTPAPATTGGFKVLKVE